MSDVIEIKGLDKLVKRLENLGDLSTVKAAIKAAALHVKGKIAVYPPGSEANTAGPYPKQWYIRGVGQFWARVDGSVGARFSSEDLGQKWTIKTRDSGLTAVVGNNVSYGPFVQDEEKQSWFHKRRGWKTTEQVANEEAQAVNEMIAKAIEAALKG